MLGGLFAGNRIDDEFWEGIEEALIVADVGMHTTLGLIDAVKKQAREKGVTEPAGVRALLRSEIERVLALASGEAPPEPEDARVALLMIGVNGTGKTTSIAKLANAARAEGRRVLMAAADTFRAGAIEQLQEWGRRLGIDVIAHRAGGDPGAVAFDAMNAARARGVDLLLVDTAGRLHTKRNLMAELEKVRGVLARQSEGFTLHSLLVMDGVTGQNGLAQARAFNEAIGCDGVFLTKLDGTAKGGIALAIAGELKLPVWYVGTGESVEDFSAFNARAFAAALLPEPAEA